MPDVPVIPSILPGHQMYRNYRAINVQVPEEVYWHVRRCATASKMSLKEFMSAFCRQAQPLLHDHQVMRK